MQSEGKKVQSSATEFQVINGQSELYAEGLKKVNPTKVVETAAMPAPNDRSALQRFLWTVNNLSNFSPHLALDMCQPLWTLLENNFFAQIWNI